jgi:hypothetical protein
MPQRERKPHWLGRTSGGEVPTVLTYIGISSERIEMTGNIKGWTEHGRIVDAAQSDYSSGEQQTRDHIVCGSTIDFWPMFARGLLRRKMNWIYVRDLARAMTLLRGWELIETGGIHYEAACLTDPPTWIRCSIAGRPCLLCDTRNYGDTEPCRVSTAEDERYACESMGITPRSYWEMEAAFERDDLADIVEPIYYSIIGSGGCSWKPTISGLAWSLYRRHFIPMSQDVWQEEENAADGQ